MSENTQKKGTSQGLHDVMSASRVPTSTKPQEVHKWLQDFSWEFDKNSTKYGTKYDMAVDTKEQFKITAKEYARMEAVKEERQYGTLLDGLDRLGVAKRVDPRWAEIAKAYSVFIECGEFNAISGSALLWDCAKSPEQKNGYLAQVIDEVRHTNQAAYVNAYYAKHGNDPAGHNAGRQVRAVGPAFRGVKRAFGDGFNAGDAVECSINLQLVAEACYTNPLIIALTEWAAANGDEITPTIFTSIQTDEMRHMANGFQTIVSIINDPEGSKYLNDDINKAFWSQSSYFVPLIGFIFEYYGENKIEAWYKTWDRWVYEDWAGIWLGRLSSFGVKTPPCLRDVKKIAVWGHHDLALLSYALWPMNHFGMTLPSEKDMAWFEENYPGWYDHYGVIYDEWRALGCEDPNSGFIPATWLLENGHVPYFDAVSAVPFCPSLAKAECTLSIVEHNGRKFAFSSPHSERLFLAEPERYEAQSWFEQFEGWEMSEVIRASGGLRSDGKTLMAQPHLNGGDKMWTIDDIKKADVVIPNPLGLHE